MTARVICMASPKGGTGKTALTATFGTFLAGLGKNVLLVDADGATNGLTLFYLKEVTVHGSLARAEGRQPLGIYDCDETDKELEIVPLASGLNLAPATFRFRDTEDTDIQAFRACLSDRLIGPRESFDYIFLDAQAGSDWRAREAMSRNVSDEVIIVSEYDPMSAAGIERLKALLRDDLSYVRTWVLLNKMLPEFVKSFSEFLEVAKYLSPIPWDADVVRAYARRSLALDLEYVNEHTIAVLKTLRLLLGQEISDEVEAWLADKGALLRQPLDTQLEDAKRELEALSSEMSETVSRSQKLKNASRFLDMAFGMVAVAGGVIVTYAGLYFASTPGLPFLPVVSLSGGLGLGIAFLVMQYFLSVRSKKEPRSFVNSALLEARFDRVFDRISKLEALRDSDVETLIRSRDRTQTRDS